MGRHFRQVRSAHRDYRAGVNLRRVLGHYPDARVGRCLRQLPDFLQGVEHSHVLSVMLSTANVAEARFRLAIILNDDGSIADTAWLERPTQESVVAMAGLLTIQASLAEPMDLIVDSGLPLHTHIANGLTVDQAVSLIVAKAREWADIFETAFTRGYGVDMVALLAQFQREVACAALAAREVTVLIAAAAADSYSWPAATTNQALHVAS